MLWIIPAFGFFWLAEMLHLDRLTTLLTFSHPVASVLITLAALRSILRISRNLSSPVTEQAQFWISAGVVVIDSGTLLISIIDGILIKYAPETFISVFMIQPVLLFIANLLFIGGFRCKEKTSSGSSLLAQG
ncbi:MAG: hypothetical protein HY033_06300 [Ignavibacteriae bacterium]|nr:hypothetical protein [Ignavibacteria bacterium]MBI3364503.1 hypothetical protein [Ignavibacteriota bacterium]